MKKLFAVALVLCLIAPCAFAEDIDLSELTFDELRALQKRIDEELITRPEWVEVAVPVGVYEIGVDIPAGDWCLRAGYLEDDYVIVSYSKEINETRTGIGSWIFLEKIYKEGLGDGIKREFLNCTLSEGCYLQVKYGWVVFTPPVHIDLGF